MKRSMYNSLTKGESIFGICYLLFQQFALAYLLVFLTALAGLKLSTLWLNMLFFSINFLVIVIAFSRYLAAQLRVLGKSILLCLGSCVTGFLMYWAANVLLNIFIAVYFPGFTNSNNENIQYMAAEQFWVMFVGAVLLVPIVEETLYRGVFFGLARRWGRPLAYALSVAAFSAIHVVGYIGSAEPVYLLVSFLQYIPAGVCLAWAYDRTGTIFAPTLIHTAVNLIGMLSMR